MNIENFTDSAQIPIKLNEKMRVKKRQAKPFLRGPIPMDWLYAAGRLPGQCLQVGLGLWHEVGMAKSRTITFRPSKALKFGMSRDTARRAIKRLEGAKLIHVRQRPGRCLEVQILDVEAPASGAVEFGVP